MGNIQQQAATQNQQQDAGNTNNNNNATEKGESIEVHVNAEGNDKTSTNQQQSAAAEGSSGGGGNNNEHELLLQSGTVVQTSSKTTSLTLQDIYRQNEDAEYNINASSQVEMLNKITRYVIILEAACDTAKERVQSLIRKHQNDREAFGMLDQNLDTLKSKLKEISTWHKEKHDQGRGIVNPSIAAATGQDSFIPENVDHKKRLYLAEAALLLILPVMASLLSCDLARSKRKDEKPGEITKIASTRRASISEIHPTYQWKYDGTTIDSLVESIEQRGCCACLCSNSLSIRQRDDAMILGSRIYACCSLSDIIMKESANEDHDLMLERALGIESVLEVKGIETHCGTMYNEQKMKTNLDAFLDRVLWANAMVDAGYAYNNTCMRGLCFSTAGCYWGMPCLQAQAAHRGEACYAATPEEVSTKKLTFVRYVWNLPETDLVRNFFKLGLPSIKIDHQFYLAPCSSYGPSMPQLEGGDEPVPCRIISNRSMQRLPSTKTREAALGLPIPVGISPVEIKKNHSDTLIVHFHGGGFIAMTSFSHENYTRHWAKSLGVPILSVDYRLAPDFVFPVPLNDSYRAYLWAISQAEEQLGYTPKKIILVGDSAGGNHAAAVAVRAIMDKKRIPDGVLLAYPASDLRRKFSPSMLFSFSDRLLPYVFAEACMAAYLGPDKEEANKLAQNPLVSPVMAPSDILKQFPVTRIVVGDKDPIMDQGINFGHRLAREGVDVKIKVYPGMPHGFLSFGEWPLVGVQEVLQCVHDCGNILQELIDYQKPSADVAATTEATTTVAIV